MAQLILDIALSIDLEPFSPARAKPQRP
jgi:hypothetical protein